MINLSADMRHLYSEEITSQISDKELAARDFFGSIVGAATARMNQVSLHSGISCNARVSRKKCLGSIKIERQDLPSQKILWKCDNCDQNGEIINWSGCPHDLSNYKQYELEEPGEVYFSVVITKSEFEALLNEGTYDFDSEKIFMSGEKVRSGVKISGYEGDMDNFVGFIASNSNHCKTKKYQKPLESLYQKVESRLDKIYHSKN